MRRSNLKACSITSSAPAEVIGLNVLLDRDVQFVGPVRAMKNMREETLHGLAR
jgi:hypothetical protein